MVEQAKINSFNSKKLCRESHLKSQAYDAADENSSSITSCSFEAHPIFYILNWNSEKLN